jgi:Asp-tRNA(Asn)/Glu-tRNA(Gln) amidotransferase A subunit family amidase
VDFAQVLAGYAGWLGHGHAERAAAWVTRLEVNGPEIEGFRAAPTPACPAYLPVPTRVEPASGLAAEPPTLPTDAPGALARARSRGELNAFTHLPDRVEAPARGLLCGVPVAVKDLMHVKGMPLTAGSKAMDGEVATHDAQIVARLRRAGAVIVGLTNLHEFAYGITSDNPRFGRVVNPAAPSRIPGGSSGGSAAAIAAGIVRLAVGTDTAGSIRIPAACCGIVGLKPSYDALPRDGVIDLAYSLDHVGPMGLTVDDCAVMFAALLELPTVPKWTCTDLEGITIARLGGYFDSPLDGEVRGALDAAMKALATDNARIAERTIEGVEMAPAIQLNTIAAEATAFHAERLRARGADYGEDVRVRIEMGLFLPGAWYVKAQRMRTKLAESIDGAFGDADAFISPTMRTPAPSIGAGRVDIGGRSFALHTAVTNLTLPFNLCGLPAISVPWSRSKDGVPISLQVAGKRGEDWRVLAIARRLEAASPWLRQRAST